MTAKEIFDENMKQDTYWFNRRMEELKNLAKVRQTQINIKTEPKTQRNDSFSFDKAELEYLLNLAK